MHLLHPYWLEAATVFLGVVLLFIEAFASSRLNKRIIGYIGIVGLILVFIATFFVDLNVTTGGFYSTDTLAMFFKRFMIVTTILVIIMSLDYLDVIRKFTFSSTHPRSTQGGVGEFLTIPIFTCAGLMWMVSATDFITIFVSLEAVTISFYVLVSYTRRSPASLEAGVKYLILGALSTGFIVYGITWIFGVTGQTQLDLITETILKLQIGGNSYNAALLFGFILVLVALGFKIAAAPFQIWVPDVYQGAPTPITAFLSIGSKAAGFVVLLRVLQPFLAAPGLSKTISLIILILAAASLIYGNLAALPQTNLKRLLAYSSIAHAGYLLMAVTALTIQTRALSLASISIEDHSILSVQSSIVFYFVGYLLMTALAFSVLITVSLRTGGDEIVHFNGLHQRSPGLAFAMVVAMLSLAGLPLTIGGFGKFFIFMVTLAVPSPASYVLVAIGIVTVACGFYYYLKVIRAMYFQPPWNDQTDAIPSSALTKALMIVTVAGIIVFGVYPKPVLNLYQGPASKHPVYTRTAKLNPLNH